VGLRNREIEIKMVVTSADGSYAKLTRRERIKMFESMKKLLPCSFGRTVGFACDNYFHPPKGARADFCRIRQMGRGRAQFTIKYKDRGSNFNRVEKDLELSSSQVGQMASMLSDLCGSSAKVLWKQYYVAYYSGSKHNTLSLYWLPDDKEDRTFIEIEGLTAKAVSKVKTILAQFLKKQGLRWIRERRSLFEIFVRDGGK